MIIAGQDVVHIGPEGAIGLLHDPAQQGQHLVFAPVVAREGVATRVVKDGIVGVEAHRLRDVTARQGINWLTGLASVALNLRP